MLSFSMGLYIWKAVPSVFVEGNACQKNPTWFPKYHLALLLEMMVLRCIFWQMSFSGQESFFSLLLFGNWVAHGAGVSSAIFEARVERFKWTHCSTANTRLQTQDQKLTSHYSSGYFSAKLENTKHILCHNWAQY